MSKQQYNYVLLSFFSALLAAVADVLLLFHPQADYLAGDYVFLLDIPVRRMMLGHYMGIFAIPFELPGIWVICTALMFPQQERGQKFFFLACMALALGVAYHGMVLWVATSLQVGVPLADVRPFFEPVGFSMAAIFLFLSIGFEWLVLKGRTALPKWVALFNPLVFYLLFVGLYFLAPVIGKALLVAGFNLGLACLFAAILFSKIKVAK